MPTVGKALKDMAEKYLRLAKTTAEPKARKTFLDYAAIYAQLSEQSEHQKAPTTAVDKEPTKQR